jgi:uncharacterized membrane protein
MKVLFVILLAINLIALLMMSYSALWLGGLGTEIGTLVIKTGVGTMVASNVLLVIVALLVSAFNMLSRAD